MPWLLRKSRKVILCPVLWMLRPGRWAVQVSLQHVHLHYQRVVESCYSRSALLSAQLHADPLVLLHVPHLSLVLPQALSLPTHCPAQSQSLLLKGLTLIPWLCSISSLGKFVIHSSLRNYFWHTAYSSFLSDMPLFSHDFYLCPASMLQACLPSAVFCKW